MRVLVTGAAGQLGVELLRTAPTAIEVMGLSRAQCDITDLGAVSNILHSHRPDVVINAAAYTKVDAAEANPHLAYAVNAQGTANVARAAEQLGVRFVHISTDYVFDGTRGSPYLPGSAPNPLNVYGASKLAGEIAARRVSSRALILRSGWLYASHGTNFLRTVLSALQASRALRVVNDQLGVPTSAHEFAETIWSCVDRTDIGGTQHWVNEGTASWYDFAVRIQQLALDIGLVESRTPISAITSAAYGSRAKRPRCSVLDANDLWLALGKKAAPWYNALIEVLGEVRTTYTIGG